MSIDSYIEENFDDKRKMHTKNVVKEAEILAKRYGEDQDKAKLAAKFHDMCKGLEREKMNELIKEIGLPEEYLDNDNLAHSKLAAYHMKKDFNIEDEDVINAVKYHTTGREGMSRLEQIVFLADSIEESRSFSGIEQLRELALSDLDKACLLNLDQIIEHVSEQKQFIHKDTLEARKWFDLKIKSQE